MARKTLAAVRVGLDGKPLLPPRTGVYLYTAGLLQGLQAVAGDTVANLLDDPAWPPHLPPAAGGHTRCCPWEESAPQHLALSRQVAGR
jgi:hypothetical protein